MQRGAAGVLEIVELPVVVLQGALWEFFEGFGAGLGVAIMICGLL